MTIDVPDYAPRTTQSYLASRRGLARATRFTRYSLLIILSVFIALSLLYSIATPIFEGPDEIWHYAFADQFHFNLASPKITPGGQSDRPNLFIHTAREDFPYRNTALAVHLARLI